MKTDLIIFDFAGTLVKMRPPALLIKRWLLNKYFKKYQLAIVTGGKRTEIMNILKKLSIDKFFESSNIITKNDADFVKPNPKLLKLVVKIVGGNSPIYIGDTKKDQKMAHLAGIPFISSKKLLSSRKEY